MKKFLLILFITNIFAQTISLQNCKKPTLDLSKIPKNYYHNIYIKASFDKKPHNYTGITLKNLQKLIGDKEFTFIAYDDYKVTFHLNEINQPYILFVFLQDGKPIPISKKGPAKIIYTKKDKNKDYIFKAIFLIKKVVCE